ncbi:MAG: hypothetical protein AAF288_00150 [Planctomycetota bacterium]
MTAAPTLTVFTTPKPWHGDAAVAQDNAVASWVALGPAVRVIVFGGGASAEQAAQRLGARWLPDPAVNAYGTPTVSGLFSTAKQQARSPTLAYVNADILLGPDFLSAITEVARRKKRFLAIGERIDLPVDRSEDFTPQQALATWARLSDQAGDQGQPCGPTAIDYFVYPRTLFERLPDFAIGRTAWDNWLVYHARRLRAPVIDLSERVCAIHQAHRYEHGHEARASGHRWVWNGPEARFNLKLAGGKSNLFTLWDATHRLTPQGVRAAEPRGLGGGVWSYRRSVALSRAG